jgi:hypothetical protein
LGGAWIMQGPEGKMRQRVVQCAAQRMTHEQGGKAGGAKRVPLL